MDKQDPNPPRAISPAKDSDPLPEPESYGPTPPGRRKRTFPVYYVEVAPGNLQMMYAHEYVAYQESLQKAGTAKIESEEAREAAFRAELAAGRPPVYTERSECAPSASPESSASDNPEGIVTPPVYTERSECVPTAADGGFTRGRLVESPADVVKFRLSSLSSSLARSSPSPSPPPDFARHSRVCSICSHPDRDAIDADFIRWRSPQKIAEDYGIPDRRIIYRHAHATGLFAKRTREVARVMEQYLELTEHNFTQETDLFSLDSVTRAIRVYSHLDLDGRWFEPPRTHYVLTGPIFHAQGVAAPSDEQPTAPSPRTRSAAKRPVRKKAISAAGAPRRRNSTRHIPEVESEPNS